MGNIERKLRPTIDNHNDNIAGGCAVGLLLCERDDRAAGDNDKRPDDNDNARLQLPIPDILRDQRRRAFANVLRAGSKHNAAVRHNQHDNQHNHHCADDNDNVRLLGHHDHNQHNHRRARLLERLQICFFAQRRRRLELATANQRLRSNLCVLSANEQLRR